MLEEKVFSLTDGTKLAVKVNFATLYYIQKSGADKIIKKQERLREKGKDLSEGDGMTLTAKLLYSILRSNGIKVADEDEAMMLIQPDEDTIVEMMEEFEERMNVYKKKQDAKRKLKELP